MQHLDEGTIHSWLDGALSAEEAAQVEAHATGCLQCAAAVAEARGFIAASSRILTALDDVPRGVVPAALPVKWYNRAAWRAAAAVLVVAVGSLVVIRNGGNNAPESSLLLRHETVETIAKPSSPIVVAKSPGPTTEADFSGKPARGAAPSNVAQKQRARDEAVDMTIGGNAAAAPQAAGAVIATPQSAPSSRVSGATMLQSAAAEQQQLKVVGTPRVIGAKVTLYEVAPGDTVTLTESLNVQLNSVVTTGISSAEPQVRRSMEKSAATAPTRASPSPAAPPLRTNGVTTISWPDVTTGNMLSLSGRMPVDRLNEIKLRIERERAAVAAKKKP